ncbi:hypothetical protein AMST5_00102 [freshwater sediment metagenome]|uniref:Uncharacterized protein n=1 Tax=freshwater sediment metagenome TaxID=556182 RepID=A0AA48LZY6_9ZZZZ
MALLDGAQKAELRSIVYERFNQQNAIRRILEDKNIDYPAIEEPNTDLWLGEIINHLNRSEEPIRRALDAFVEACNGDEPFLPRLKDLVAFVSRHDGQRPAAGWPTHIVLFRWLWNGARKKSEEVVDPATEALKKALDAGNNGDYEIVICNDWQNDLPTFAERDRPLFIFVAYERKIVGAQEEFKEVLESKGMGERDYGQSLVVWSVTEGDAPYSRTAGDGIPPVSVEPSELNPYKPPIWLGVAEAVALKARTKFLASGHGPAIGMEIGEYAPDVGNFVKAIVSQATDKLFEYGPPRVEPDLFHFVMVEKPTNNEQFLGYWLSKNKTNGVVVIVHDFSISIQAVTTQDIEEQFDENMLADRLVPRLIQTVKKRNTEIDKIANGEPLVKVILVSNTPVKGREKSISEKCPNWILVTHKRSTNVSPESIRGSYEDVIAAIRQRVKSQRGLQ